MGFSLRAVSKGKAYRGKVRVAMKSTALLHRADYRPPGTLRRSLIQCSSTDLSGNADMEVAVLCDCLATDAAALRHTFAALEKASFGVGAMVLYRQGRLDHGNLYFGGIDLLPAVLFIVCWLRLPSDEKRA